MRLIIPSLMAFIAANVAGQDVLYKSDLFTVYKDKVVQNNYTATVISPTEIKSNYQSATVKDAVAVDRTWKASLDRSSKPIYKSDQPLVDALFNLSVEEALKNIEADSTFRTGALWGGVWTRDISYSIFLAFAYHEPEVAKISLMKKVKRGRIIQDTGSGGAWPISSDRVIWATAAWEIYKVTGDRNWLKDCFEIIKSTLEDDWNTLANNGSGLMKGESSFLDWREQTYPKWMDNADIFLSQSLGTNVAHYNALTIAARMADALYGANAGYKFLQKAIVIKEAINKNLWLEDRGFYAQYLYGRTDLTVSPRFEALGEALAVLFDVADKEKTKSIFEKSPVTDFGVTCIYPQIPGIPPYHNDAIWPFVQSYWNLAAAKAGNEKALAHGLASIYRPAALFLTNYENMVATTGDFKGTEINSDRMLWSMAGNLAMVHRVFMGISFEENGITFNPVIPGVYGGKRSLSNFKYRNSILTITVNGFGCKIKSITFDGKNLENAFLPATVAGSHTVEIEMDNHSFDSDSFQVSANHFSLDYPVLKRDLNSISWSVIEKAKNYMVYKNGKLLKTTTDINLVIDSGETAEYKVSAVDDSGWEGFTSEPLVVIKPQGLGIVEVEDFIPKSPNPYSGYSGKGFIEISTGQNHSFKFVTTVKEEGLYFVDFRYSNGSGPWNTENKCAIRSLYVNEHMEVVASGPTATLVFPQRGTGKWSDWGFSNGTKVWLAKGENTFILRFDEWNTNMNIDVNKAMLDYMRLIKL